MKYTKKQIFEAIAYWKRRLRRLNESEGGQCSCEATLRITYNGPLSRNDPASTVYDALAEKLGSKHAGGGWDVNGLQIEVESNDQELADGLNALLQNGHI